MFLRERIVEDFVPESESFQVFFWLLCALLLTRVIFNAHAAWGWDETTELGSCTAGIPSAEYSLETKLAVILTIFRHKYGNLCLIKLCAFDIFGLLHFLSMPKVMFEKTSERLKSFEFADPKTASKFQKFQSLLLNFIIKTRKPVGHLKRPFWPSPPLGFTNVSAILYLYEPAWRKVWLSDIIFWL